MVLRTRPEDDDWQNVKDARKRKQIQDRLAQRARRRRLREARGEGDSAHHSISVRRPSRTSDSDSSSASHDQDASHLALLDLRSNNTHVLSINDPSVNWQITGFGDFESLPNFDSNPDDTNLTAPDLLPANLHSPLPSPTLTRLPLRLTVFTALFINGQILSIPCSALLASKSAPPTPAIPIPLRPTSSQLTTVHFQWIDRLPFPKLRDSLIRLQGVVDLEEFLNDIFLAPSFEIRKGAQSWDPRAWRLDDGWARKWGWLFF